MASSTIPANFAAILRSEGRRRTPQVIRAQGLKDEGRSRHNIVDANLRVLRNRMEEIRIKESLERCLVVDHGWNYASTPIGDYKYKPKTKQSQFSELVQIVCTTFGLTILTGTLWLCLASLLVHLNQ